MKKKILSICLVVALAATAIIGASLAYFTDTDKADNVFTFGSVKIDLIEQQRGENGLLEEFKDVEGMLPIVGSAQGDSETITIAEGNTVDMPTAANYVDKIITVKNTGVSDAYVRCYFAIPQLLDDGAETFDASKNALHFNMGDTDKWAWKTTNGAWNYFTATIDGVACNVYYADYEDAIAKDALTTVFVKGVYLDKNVDMDAEGNLTKGDANLGKWSNGITCPVAAVAVQAEGFADATTALNEAFPSTFNPFA